MGKMWFSDHKFWLPTCLIYELHKNMILNVTLHARKVMVIKKQEKDSTLKSSEANVVFGFCL